MPASYSNYYEVWSSHQLEMLGRKGTLFQNDKCTIDAIDAID